jgi:ABC-2 type transport system permease protein
MQFTSLIVGVKKSEAPLFKLIWKLSGRERLFKQSLLPILSYAAIMPIIISYTSGNFSSIEKKYLPFLYFTIMSSSLLPSILSIGNNKNSDWLFKILPYVLPHNIFKASLKATLAKFFVPVFILVSIPLFYFQGASAILDLTCIFLFNLMIASFTLYYQAPHFAFSQEKAATQGGKTGLKMFLIILIALPLGFLHSFLHNQNIFLVLIPTVVYGTLLYFMNKHWLKKRYNWKYINLTNNQF